MMQNKDNKYILKGEGGRCNHKQAVLGNKSNMQKIKIKKSILPS
jgi:hypothetical protein